ncbi:aminotransferase-like domain-containing protein [Paenibacillus apiarius]|uniref:PLP-dependent aminotransferase family protein n=1 Tax=Paenibacillus apiarius TaxID=46240 RepID=A0ABT4DYK9_9BACL|nr:PLP-dependent aminotransferase family protein [Paenibacillus apiarius]MCY9515000.1 PLP-dependent aminotransferase family protein [Paenibacillus apiarius]MCY9522437.1 PLP-dependent aminotransferase family protein [Paenibacillus apiarius]MCY9552143.1 PLP-dependent aminotransferase family protein [Paenibacillus apiarius]MCY9561070.1 PLP-dependent aminotransferase family protein [Paenibacillus apiarius]MCY9686289.1 PLP-dependent aminotransferase family protein [Paenibacillus apiarius]
MDDIDWRPDPSLPIPLYRQIEEFMKRKIAGGEWTVGMKLPSQRDLAAAFQVNRSTLVTALEQLTSQGYIAGKSGGGTTIIHHQPERQEEAPPPPNWNAYVEDGVHYPNLPTIQTINRMEFDPEIIRLGTGELSPELLPQRQLQQLFAELARQHVPLGYEEALGSYALRSQVSAHLKTIGIAAPPSAILIVSGSLQAFQLISAGLLEKGSAMLLEKPSYLYSIHAFQSAGMKLIGLPMDESGLQLSHVERFKRQYDASLLYTIPTFHNPTGAIMGEARRRELLQTSRRIGLPILEDGAYEELWFDDEALPPPLRALDMHGQVLYVGTMSKVVSPGLRIGWVVGPQPVIERLADIKMQTDYGSSSLSQAAAAEWFGAGLHAEHCRVIRRQLKERRDCMLRLLDAHWSDFATWNTPKGGFYIWVTLHAEISMAALFERALKRGILINPGYIYDRSAKKQLRLSYSYASFSEMESSVRQLAALIGQLGNHLR